MGVFKKLKSKLAAVNSTEVIVIILATTIVATGTGVAVKNVVTGDNGIVSNIESRIENAPAAIDSNQSGSSGSGSEGAGESGNSESSPYGTLTKSWDISEAQDGSVTMDYYDDTKTAVVSGNGTIGRDFVSVILAGIDIKKAFSDEDYLNEFLSTHSDDHDHIVQYDFPAETLIIDNSVTELAENAFSECKTIKSILLPNSITTIGGCAFYNIANNATIYCESQYVLNLIKWEDPIAHYNIEQNITIVVDNSKF